jgi:TonB family protein
MKKRILILLLVIFSTKIYSQENKFRDTINVNLDSLNEPTQYYGDWQVPNFVGGNKELLNYLNKELIYPQTARKDSIQGTVWVGFDISEKGEIFNVKITKGIREDLNQEVLRVILKMPIWTPGKENGHVVGGHFNLPVKFALDKTDKNNSR